MMRHYMVCPQNEEILHKIPVDVKNRIRAEAIEECTTEYINFDCAWGQGECIPNCPSCKRMNDLLTERVAGYKEGLRDAYMAVAVRLTQMGYDTEGTNPYLAAIDNLLEP